MQHLNVDTTRRKTYISDNRPSDETISNRHHMRILFLIYYLDVIELDIEVLIY